MLQLLETESNEETFRPSVAAVRPRPGDPSDGHGDARAGGQEALRDLLHDGLLQRLRHVARVQGLEPPRGQGQFICTFTYAIRPLCRRLSSPVTSKGKSFRISSAN